tara:strand:- start:649 stop:1536 length:888 start_codon:yes stop_codon:yes gene_type:complete
MKAPKKELLKFCRPDLYAISNFESRKLLCQHCSNYKDTFGSWLKILEGIPDTKKDPERFAAALNAWGLTEAPNMEELHEYFSECVEYQPSFEFLKNSVRISSFSSQRFNPLIWSSYADGLHGFCIVFDEKVLMDKEQGSELRDVEYSCSAPTVDTFEYAIAHDQYIFHQLALEEEITSLRQQEQDYTTKVIEDYKTAADKAFTKKREFWHKIFAVKPSELEYECERRLIVPVDLKDNSPSFFTYSSDAVIEVILGEDMNKRYRKKLYGLIKERYPEVTISTAHRAKNGTGIEVSP